MNNPPFFSIIVPTYNQAQYLPLALDSIVSQTDGDWEAVVVDDGSTDDTRKALREYSSRDKRIRVFRKENGGTASALNLGLTEAQGKWICWLSSDDMFDTRKLEINRMEIENHPGVDFFFSYFRLLNEYTGELTDHDLWGPLPEHEFYIVGLFYRNYVSGITICVRRDTFRRVGFFDEKLRYAQDYDMWLRLLSISTARFIPEWTVTNRNHSGQGSEVFPQACIYDTAKAAIRFINSTPFEGLFPGFDLNNKGNSTRSVERILEIAADPSSFVYWLGPHPALLIKAAEWIDRRRRDNAAIGKGLQDLLQKKASEVKEKNGPGRFSFIWKVTAAATRLRCAFACDPVSSKVVGEAHYSSMFAADASEKEPLRKYLEQYESSSIDDRRVLNGKGEVVFAIPGNVSFEDDTADGTVLGSVSLMARCLANAGVSVVVLGLGNAEMRYRDGIFVVSVPAPQAQTDFLSFLTPLDVVVTLGQEGLELPRSMLRAVYDPVEDFLVVKRKGRRPVGIGRVDGEGLKETMNRLLRMAQAKERKLQEKSRIVRALDYVRRKADSLLTR